MIVVELLSSDAAGVKGGVHDPNYKRILVAFNARPERHLLRWPAGEYYMNLLQVRLTLCFFVLQGS